MSWSYADTATQEGAEMDQNEIDILERVLKPCPFCAGKPFFEETVSGWFVACDCGARVPGDDAQDAAAKWCIRPPMSVAKSNVRSVAREHWTGY
jgi:hypothetical protein